VSTLLTHQRVCTWLGWRLSLFSSVRRSSASRLAGTSRARLHHCVYPVDSSARVHLVGVAFVSLLQRAAQLGEQAGRHACGQRVARASVRAQHHLYTSPSESKDTALFSIGMILQDNVLLTVNVLCGASNASRASVYSHGNGKGNESARQGTGFGWEVAHAAVSRRPPIYLDTMVARNEGYTYAAKVWDLSILQGPFSVAPCQPWRYDSQLFHRSPLVAQGFVHNIVRTAFSFGLSLALLTRVERAAPASDACTRASLASANTSASSSVRSLTASSTPCAPHTRFLST
jgi:hypothetical protein